MLIADMDVAAVLASEVCCAVVEGVEENPPLSGKIGTIPKLFLATHNWLPNDRSSDCTKRDISAPTITSPSWEVRAGIAPERKFGW